MLSSKSFILDTPSAKQEAASLEITLPASVSRPITLPYVWLRDSCPCETCIHPSTKQKLHRTSDIPLNIKPTRTRWVKDDGQPTCESRFPDASLTDPQDEGWILEVEWDQNISMHDTTSIGVEGHQRTAKETHVSKYPAAFLRRLTSQELMNQFHYADQLETRPWLRHDLLKAHYHVNKEPLKDENRPDGLFIPYADVLKSKATLLQTLTQLTQYGIVVFTGVPTTLPSTPQEDWELRRVANLVSYVRETFYGDLWDVKKIGGGKSRNIAYTDLDLDLHMDLLYMANPPRYQLLHCLRNRNIVGGQSLFVDALQAARTLYQDDQEAFDILSNTDVEFHYINDGHHLVQRHKTIVVSPSTSPFAFPNVTAVNYSPPFQAPIPLSSTPPGFYPALHKFAALLRRPEARYEFLMKEGDLACFDNRRVLHARKAFREKEGSEGESVRWLKGCYVESDAVVDRIRVLEGQRRKGKLEN